MIDLDDFEYDLKGLIEEYQLDGEEVDAKAIAGYAHQRIARALRRERQDAAFERDKIVAQHLENRVDDLKTKVRLLDRLEAHTSDRFTKKERLRLSYQFFAKAVSESNGDEAAKYLEDIISRSTGRKKLNSPATSSDEVA